MLISPMPSPKGSNREQLYILRGGARRAKPAGAYDEAPGERDPVMAIAQWVSENLSQEDQSRLLERLAMKPAQDDEDGGASPSLDPYDTRRRAPGQAKAMDAMVARVLAKQFPGIEKIDVQPMETGPRRPAVEQDAARLKSLAERFPGFGRIGFA